MIRSLIFSCFFCTSICAQEEILTSDLDNFWMAYDQLSTCTSKQDSIAMFQTQYIEKASEGFKAFLEVRSFTASEYYRLVRSYPKFWESIRENTMRVKTILPTIEKMYSSYRSAFPDHEAPKICFAIGTLSTGGTVHDGYLLIGTEMAAADSTTNKSELGSWLNAVMTDEFDVQNMIAHEYVHTMQKMSAMSAMGAWGYFSYRVLMVSIYEGAADFIAKTITGATINTNIYVYGNSNESEIWDNFQKDMMSNRESNWLYQGDNTEGDVPADLGYYVGFKICESYYQKASDKEKALQDIVSIKNFRRFYRKSGYMK